MKKAMCHKDTTRGNMQIELATHEALI